jgi:DNA-directed RNA polymerase subunit RPC12/RpoP
MDKEKNKAKSLKLGKDDIICPSCNSVITIADELKDDELIQCPKCDAAINNPFFYSGKFVICANCGNNAELPKTLENELVVNCSICRQDVINPHSNEYNPITCPHCFMNIHIPEEIIHERYILCPNCQNDFKNTLRQQKNTNTLISKQNISSSQQNPTSKSNSVIVDEPINLTKKQKNWIAGIVIFVIILIIGYVTDNSSSSSSTLYSVNTTTYVATSKSSFDEMFRYINDGDNQALSTLMSYGEVQTLSAGTKVNLISSHFSYCVVRRQGSTSKLWIVTEHITKE